ncbi:MAG TPA: NAD-dependent succinate-semialdehyde dehydrogenase [Vicinamibacterales bacterium]|nr:NAD-dependent succinate-semialdehyde dehydrogenase [Vicinamibacterales bacterium]
MPLISTNPTTGVELARYDEMSADEIDRALSAARRAFDEWRGTSFDARATVIRAAATELRARKVELARLMAIEMGKPLEQGEAEIDKCAAACEFFATQAPALLADQDVKTEASRSFVAFKPFGVILGVMPWNFPFWQVFRYTAPALMAGNATVLKHSSNVVGCALAIEEILKAAGAPPGLFVTLRMGSKRVGEVIDDRRIAAVTLTGSTPAGRDVAARAGRALKKQVLELGGSDPYVILDDADIASAVKICVSSRLINSGQSCVAAKRFICTTRRAAEVEALFVKEMQLKTMGDPLIGVDVGPQARVDLRDELDQQVHASLAKGARALVGGVRPEGPGAFYPPTVLTNVRKGMPAYDDELFGPVAAIIATESEDEALRVANDTAFGLGAAVFTRDLERGTRIAADQLDAGNCFVNALVRSDPRLPFGGIKDSGYGRELSAFGIREFVNIKTVWVA